MSAKVKDSFRTTWKNNALDGTLGLYCAFFREKKSVVSAHSRLAAMPSSSGAHVQVRQYFLWYLSLCILHMPFADMYRVVCIARHEGCVEQSRVAVAELWVCGLRCRICILRHFFCIVWWVHEDIGNVRCHEVKVCRHDLLLWKTKGRRVTNKLVRHI